MKKRLKFIKKIRKAEDCIRCIELYNVCLCKYSSGDYNPVMYLDKEMKKFIKERLINIKDIYYKELSEI